MDGLESVTYFIAGLGVIVLSLCVIVAGLLIYQYCRSVTFFTCISHVNLVYPVLSHSIDNQMY